MAAIRGALGAAGPNLPLGLGLQPTNEYSLAGGESFAIPSGEYLIGLGLYTSLEVWDTTLQTFRIIPVNTDRTYYVDSDGSNWRVINRTGCVAGAIISNHGSGYLAPTVTASAGASRWNAIVGGQLNTSVTVVTGGSGYTYPPRVSIPAPSGLGSASAGVQATATCTLSAGVVNAVTITNQGAGYKTAPTLTFITDPRDPATNIVPAAPIVQPLTGAGVVSALICIDPGSAQTAAPTLTIADAAGTSAAATAMMCFSATGYTLASGGTGFGAGTFITGSVQALPATPQDTNPANQGGIIVPRVPKITPALSGGVIQASATTAPTFVEDWGWGLFGGATQINAVPVPGTGLATAVATPTFTFGSQTDTFWIQPLRG